MNSHSPPPAVPPEDDPSDDLRCLLPDEEEPAAVFFRSALVYFGPAAEALEKSFDCLYLMALESNYYDATIAEGTLFGVEAQAIAQDLKALSQHAARLAVQGPLDAQSLRQRKISLEVAEIARDLRRLHERLEAVCG